MRGLARLPVACHPIVRGFVAVGDAVSIVQEHQVELHGVSCFFNSLERACTYVLH